MILLLAIPAAFIIDYLIRTYDKEDRVEKFIEKLFPSNPHNMNHKH